MTILTKSVVSANAEMNHHRAEDDQSNPGPRPQAGRPSIRPLPLPRARQLKTGLIRQSWSWKWLSLLQRFLQWMPVVLRGLLLLSDVRWDVLRNQYKQGC
uniref:Uncharacterized protein n=1 Tax=Globodera pallida TaxID=36090 RepID=A0A183BL19_GLOPA